MQKIFFREEETQLIVTNATILIKLPYRDPYEQNHFLMEAKTLYFLTRTE